MENFRRDNFNYVGVDLHKNTNIAALTNCFGDIIKTFKFKNSPNYFVDFLDSVHGSSDKPLIYGLEDTNFYGRALARFLIDHGNTVKEVNSSYVKKRKNRGANRDKTDVKDAVEIAKTLSSEYFLHSLANPQDLFLAIRQIVSARSNYVVTATNYKNSLHNLIIYNYPNYTDIFKNFESKTARGFFIEYPSPNLLEGVSEFELRKVLKKYNPSLYISKPKEILDCVSKNGWYYSKYQIERNFLIESYLDTLEELINIIDQLERELDRLITETGYPLLSIPGVDTVLAATIIANIGDIKRFSNSKKLAKFAGIAPIEHSSGQTVSRYSNRLGNRELNSALYSLALTQIRKDVNPVMNKYYQKKIKEGRKKKQAMVFVMRRLVNIIYSIMKNKSSYIEPSNTEKSKAGAN